MPLLLGIDTGGTYTDAVLLDDDRGVVAKAKSLTTRDDLAIGIAGAVDRVLADSGVPAGDIALVSLSTTLATNALVEGYGGRVCLVFIGFGDPDLDKAGLRDALGADPAILLAGGHDTHGNPRAPFDLATLEQRLAEIGDTVTGFAVTAHFGSRNPAHEIAARDLIRRVSDLPVTCGHELSARLGGPRRALTCLLNARLISLLSRLTHATADFMAARGIGAPLMVVRGDGALISAELANARPVETILSGPAASLVGAAWLTGRRDAVVSDIGGTTTDVAILRDGQPRIDEDGATVGGWRTMVEAVAMRTIGLGGDSEVTRAEEPGDDALRLGPRRVVPISLLATQHRELVYETLHRQLAEDEPARLAGRFILPMRASPAQLAGLSVSERGLYDRALAGPQALDRLAGGAFRDSTLARLVSKGLVQVAGFTPSDAAHVVGEHDGWDAAAALAGARLFARKRDRMGRRLAPDGETVSRMTIATLIRRSAEVLLESAFAADGYHGNALSRHELAAAALDRREGLVRIGLELGVPVIGLGASAATYYPRVAALLGAEPVVPEHADVANAVGAVVGRVRAVAQVTVSQPMPGLFRVHFATAPADFPALDAAIAAAERGVTDEARDHAARAGAEAVEIRLAREEKVATVDGQAMFIEAIVTATAAGRPRIATKGATR